MARKMIRAVSRDQIIKAINTEPLQPGNWVHREDLAVIGDCGVCAVGGVLRSLGLSNDMISDKVTSVLNRATVYDESDREGSEGDIRRTLKAKDYLGALSMKFEFISRRHYGEVLKGKTLARVRKELVAFVKKNFPSRVKLINPIPVLKRPTLAQLEALGIDYARSQLVFTDQE
jgi:hypothetical protein